MSKKHTFDYVYTYIKNRGYELISTTYNSCDEKLTIKDSEGYYYFLTFNQFSKGISFRKVNLTNPYSIMNIRLWCKLNNKSFELLSDKYEGQSKNLIWKCLNCNKQFDCSWNNIWSNSQCPYCLGRRLDISNCLATKKPELAKEWHPTKNGNLTPYDVTANVNKKVWWQCNKNPKHEWQSYIFNRSQCPYCSGRLPSDEYNLLICYPEICKEWNYEKNNKNPENYTPNSRKKVWWKCKECGHEWCASIRDRTRSDGKETGCPLCWKSKGEKKIFDVLNSHNLIFEIEYDKFPDLVSDFGNPLRFDFAVFEDNKKTKIKMLIEYDGQQHFRWTKFLMSKKEFKILQHHDKLKNEFCKNNNIKLLRIPYWEFDNIEKILEKELESVY